MPWEFRERAQCKVNAVNIDGDCIQTVRRLYRVLRDATAALKRSVVYFTEFLQRSYGAVTAISVLPMLSYRIH